jgi:MtN3 and saliva related transmembrane protein
MNSEIQLQIIGFTGGGLIVISLIPQLITIIQNKSSKNISIPMYFLLLLAQILWILYGVLKNDLQVLLTNACAGFITILTIKII